MKKVLAIIISVLLLTSAIVPTLAAEASGTCGEGLQWQLADGTLTVTGSGAMTDFAENEMAPWYGFREQITAVSLPEGLTSVGSLAFYGCTALNAVTLPQSVTAIGSYAFAECTALYTVRLGSGVTTIGDGAFRACAKLSAVTLPDSLVKIGDRAFYRCASLTAVTVPASVEKLGVSVFAYCKSLVRATVLANLQKLPTWTFYGCSSLAEVTLSASVTRSGEYAFRGCDGIETISTSSGDPTVANELLESIRRGDASFTADSSVTTQPPAESSSVVSGGSQTTVTEKESSTITVKKESTGEKETASIDASLNTPEGWQDIRDTIEKIRDEGTGGTLDITVQPEDSTVSGKDLAKVSGEDATVTIRSDDGSLWKIDAKDTAEKDFSGKYGLGASVSPTDSEQSGIESDNIYKVGFKDNIDFNVTVGIKTEKKNARQYATLYEKDKEVQTVVVDDDGYAWFRLGNISKKSDYYVGINAKGADTADAAVPATLVEAYGIDYTLTDASGKSYQITGRSSRWGITGGQFATYVGIAVALVVLIVTLVMVTLNKLAKNKARYAVPQGDDTAIDEDALRMQVMQEMLEEARQSKNKKE